MLDAHLLAGFAEQWVDPSGAIPRREDPGGSAQGRQQTMPSRISSPLPSSHPVAGDTPIPTTTTSALDEFAVAEANPGDSVAVAFDRPTGDAAAHLDAVAGMHLGDDLAHLGAEAADHRGRRTLEHDDRAPGLGGGRGDFETDETGADHDDPRSIRQPAAQRQRVVEGAQHRHAVEVGLAGQRPRRAAGGDDHPIAGDDSPVCSVTVGVTRRATWR